MERSPPALPAGVPPSDPGWSRVHMKYVEDSSTLLRYISLLHLAPDPPTVLLIDELEQIVASQSGSLGSGAGSHGRHGSRDGQLCRILAVAKDTLVSVVRTITCSAS